MFIFINLFKRNEQSISFLTKVCLNKNIYENFVFCNKITQVVRFINPNVLFGYHHGNVGLLWLFFNNRNKC